MERPSILMDQWNQYCENVCFIKNKALKQPNQNSSGIQRTR